MDNTKLYPNTTQYPNWLLDKLMAYLTGSEFKVLSYIVRRTYGFRKDKDSISLGQMSEGNRKTDADGVLVEHGTGLSRDSVRKALSVLAEETNIVVRDDSVVGREHSFSLNLDPATIAMLWLEERRTDKAEGYQQRLINLDPLPTTPPPGGKREGGGGSKRDRGGGGKRDPQKQRRNKEETKEEVAAMPPRKMSDIPTTAGMRYGLQQFSRKRFYNLGQKQLMWDLEQEVGTAILKKAVDWKIGVGGSMDLNAIATCARKMAREARREEAQTQRTTHVEQVHELRTTPKPHTWWDDVLDALKGKMTHADFQAMWVGTEAIAANGGVTIYAQTDRHREWMDHRLRRMVTDVVWGVLMEEPEITFTTKGNT